MSQKLIYTDGLEAKTINPWDIEDRPEAWSFISRASQAELDAMFYKVAASFRAVNKRAVAAAAVPFSIMKGKTVYDDSAKWENKVGFMPRPRDLVKRISLSLTFTNKAYLLRGKNIAGVDKNLNFLVPTTIREVVSPVTGLLDYYERTINGRPVKYLPNDLSLVHIWQLDHTTELLPSDNTAIKAIFNSTGSIYFADLFIRNFYQRGGVKPTILSLKGAVFKETKEEVERAWDRFVRNISKFSAKIFNADQMDIKPFGAGVDDLKNNEVYRQAIENIAMGIGMPASHLLSDWDSYATAQVDYMMWMRDDIFPLCEAIAEDLNDQVFTPLGLKMVHNTETTDTETEDEVARADAIEKYLDIILKAPSYEIFEAIMINNGAEISPVLEKAGKQYFANKETAAKETAAQMSAAPAPAPQPAPISAPAPDQIPEPPQPPEPPAAKDYETSAMIALRIPDTIRAELAARYDFIDAETLNNLHITLIFLGDNRTLDRLDIMRAISELGDFQAPIKGRLQGLVRFVSRGDLDPISITFDSPQMPRLFIYLAASLDQYHIPYHRDHGFIPHLTLAYIPAGDDLPLETIEPIEINFGELYYVDGNIWYPIELLGSENKTRSQAAPRWAPSIDQLQELRIYRKAALQRYKRGDPLDFEYLPHYGGLPDHVIAQVKTGLERASSEEEIKAIFDLDLDPATQTPAPAYKTGELADLAAALRELAAMKSAQAPAPQPNIYMSPINLTAQMPAPGQPHIVFSPVIEPSPVTIENAVTVEPAPVNLPAARREIQKVKRNADGLISETDTRIEY